MTLEIHKEIEKHQFKINAYKASTFEWLKSNEHLYTHALTLTFRPARINAYTKKLNNSLVMCSPEMVLQYKESMRQFIRRLNKSIYGSAGVRKNKLVIVPVIEGLFGDKVPHYHCCVGVEPSKFDMLETSIKESWSEVPFSGNQIKVEPYRDSGWLTYINKFSQTPNQITIDWENASINSKS
jgi:hypothetical protein